MKSHTLRFHTIKTSMVCIVGQLYLRTGVYNCRKERCSRHGIVRRGFSVEARPGMRRNGGGVIEELSDGFVLVMEAIWRVKGGAKNCKMDDPF